MTKRNKKYKPKPIKNPISNLLISTFLYTRLSRLLTELVQKGTAIYSEDGAVIVNDDGSLFLAEEVIQSAMHFLVIYEDNQKIDFGINYMPFERLVQQLNAEKVNIKTSMGRRSNPMTFTTLLFIITLGVLALLSIAVIRLYDLHYKQQADVEQAYTQFTWLDKRIGQLKDKMDRNDQQPAKRHHRKGVRK